MKKMFLVFLFLIFGNFSAYSQCDILNNLDRIIHTKSQKYEGKSYLQKDFSVKDSSNKYFKLVQSNSRNLDYILTNFTDYISPDSLSKINNPIEIEINYIKHLKKDTDFCRILCELEAKTITKTSPKDNVTMNQMLNIAVKFFSISINDGENLHLHICTGLNEISATESVRQPHLEAFCFKTIMNEIQNPRYNVYNEFVQIMEEINNINLGIKKEDKLLRMQGALFIMMKKNPKLKQLLTEKYNEDAEYLPFILGN